MPSRSADVPKPREVAVRGGGVRAAKGSIGKIACTKNFHCVRACDAKVFYKVLVQLSN